MKRLVVLMILLPIMGFGQRVKMPLYVGGTIITDSTSSLLITVHYNSELLSTNKLAIWDEYYANIIFYNFITDSSHQLFPADTFIKRFTNDNNYLSYPYYAAQRAPDNISANWCFIL